MNIFIVGVGRSGTKFLKNVLKRHPLIHISNETHFFSKALHNGFIKTANQLGNLQKDENVKKLVDKIFDKKIFGSFWKGGYLTDKEKILQLFLNSDRSFKSLYRIILEEDKNKNKKKYGGDKTPSHIYHVNTILNWFPDSKVLHIIRNPKNVLTSDIFKNVKPDYPVSKNSIFYNVGIFLAVLYNWKKAAELDNEYEEKYPDNYFLIRYEDLLHNHKNCVQKICNFLGVEFYEVMLNPPVKDSSFTGTLSSETKKRDYKFKSYFNKLINIVAGKKMRKYGYA